MGIQIEEGLGTRNHYEQAGADSFCIAQVESKPSMTGTKKITIIIMCLLTDH